MRTQAKPETLAITDFKNRNRPIARSRRVDIERKAASRERKGSTMKNFGSVWLIAVAHIACTTTDAAGLLYVTAEGEMLICSDDADAPTDAHYVARIGPNVDPLFVAARLRHVARFLA